LKDSLIFLSTGAIFLFVGLVCLIFPKKIQKYTINNYGKDRFNPLREWIKTPSYIFALRMTGIIGLLGFAIILYAMVLGK
jgi:hypothetical protein